jgi:hypothetical protein
MRLATLLRLSRTIVPAAALLALASTTASAQVPTRHPGPRAVYAAPIYAAPVYTGRAYARPVYVRPVIYTRPVYVAPAYRPVYRPAVAVVVAPARPAVVVARPIVVVRRPIVAAPAVYVGVYRR